jgi:hypothetical protein
MKLNTISVLTLWNMEALNKLCNINANYVVTLCYYCESFNDYSMDRMYKFNLSRMEFFNLFSGQK